MTLYNPGDSVSNISQYVIGSDVTMTSKTFSIWAKYDGPHSAYGTANEPYQILWYICGIGFAFDPQSSNIRILYEGVIWSSYSYSGYLDKNWHQYTVTFDSNGYAKIYVDGQYYASSSYRTTQAVYSSDYYRLTLTAKHDQFKDITNGYVTRFVVFNKELNSTEVSSDYAKGNTSQPDMTNVAHFYDMTVSSESIQDKVGNWNLTIEGNNQITRE